MFSFICVLIDGWVNNRKAGDLGRYRAHYDVIVIYYSVEYDNHFDFTKNEPSYLKSAWEATLETCVQNDVYEDVLRGGCHDDIL